MSSVGTPNAGNDNEKMSNALTPSLPHANNASALVQDELYPKLLTAKRVLAVNLKHLKNELEWVKGYDLDDLATEFQEIKNLLLIIKLALMITFATRRLKCNYLVMWKTCLIGVCNCMMAL